MLMVTKRPQLNSEELAQLKWLLGSALACFSAWSVFFMNIDAWALVGGVTAAAVLGLIRPDWPARVPRAVHRLAFPAIVAVFVGDLVLAREPLAAFLRLDLLLILYRLMMHRSRREDLQLVVLGLFLIVVGGVLTVSLAFAVQIIVFTACTLAFLFVVHLADPPAAASSATGYGVAPNWTKGSWRDLAKRVRAATDWRLLLLSAAMFGAVVALAGALFLAIPRFEMQSGLFLDRLIERSTLSGFSDTIQFGEVTEITRDNRLALTVDVDSPAALPTVPYWRMVVLDEYTGAGFSVSSRLRRQLAKVDTRLGDTAAGPGSDTTWTLYLEAGISRYLPLLGRYRRLRFTEPQTFGRDPLTGTVALQREPARMLAFEVQGMAMRNLLADRSLTHADRAAERAQYVELPLRTADLIRLQQLVQPIQGVNQTAADFGQRATAWLHQHHRYALQSALPPGDGDPLLRWMDSSTPGHCEYFAGSLVLLARAAGHPARIVTGYKGGAWNAYSRSFGVRNSNAHAWCEIYDQTKQAWLRVDPTPAGHALDLLEGARSDQSAARSTTDESWQARLEGMRVFWYRRIVNFDQRAQLQLTSAAKDAFRRGGAIAREWLEQQAQRLDEWMSQPWDFGRAARVLGVIVAIAVLVWPVRRYGRRLLLRWRTRRSGVQADPIRREAARWLAREAARPGPQPPWPVDLREDLLRLRFGDPSGWPEPHAVFRAARRAHRGSRRVSLGREA